MEEKDLVKLYNYSEEEFLNGNNSKDIRRRNIENLLMQDFIFIKNQNGLQTLIPKQMIITKIKLKNINQFHGSEIDCAPSKKKLLLFSHPIRLARQIS